MESRAHAIAAGLFTLLLGACVVGAALWFSGELHELGETERAYVGKILEGADRMLALMNDLLDLARINAGQQANLAADDSLSLLATLLDLQAALGFADENVVIAPTDSLAAPPAPATLAATSLDVEAARLSLDAARLNARLQHRSLWSQFSISPGFEVGGL